MKIDKEYQRIKALFNDIDDKQLSLLDGVFLECARLKVELDELHEIISKTGQVKFNPKDPTQQKELPVSKVIVKTRANYLNYKAKLSNILGRNIEDEEDEDLGDFE
ncbi:MAG: hypothetical protein ACRCXT_00265 [Paraclostridium sp.]